MVFPQQLSQALVPYQPSGPFAGPLPAVPYQLEQNVPVPQAAPQPFAAHAATGYYSPPMRPSAMPAPMAQVPAMPAPMPAPMPPPQMMPDLVAAAQIPATTSNLGTLCYSVLQAPPVHMGSLGAMGPEMAPGHPG